jgi:hypothetical protein
LKLVLIYLYKRLIQPIKNTQKMKTSKLKIESIVREIRISKMAVLILLLIGFTINISAQQVEIQGKAKVSVMDTANSENLLVVKKADGTLATRQVSSLPPDQPDTTRTLTTDFELARQLCDCANKMPPFLVESILASGYTPEILLGAGVSVTDLLAGGVSPIDIYNGGAIIDSLYGKSYQGGLIFYLDTLDVHPLFEGLVAASSDQSLYAEWGCPSESVPGADGTAIGTGNQNTIDIDLYCTDPGLAADTCANLILNGYDDWFLPSQDELNLMWENLADSDGDNNNLGLSDPNNLGGFLTGGYWSSSEIDAVEAWRQSFLEGNLVPQPKANAYIVRAIRAF